MFVLQLNDRTRFFSRIVVLRGGQQSKSAVSQPPALCLLWSRPVTEVQVVIEQHVGQ